MLLQVKKDTVIFGTEAYMLHLQINHWQLIYHLVEFSKAVFPFDQLYQLLVLSHSLEYRV